MVKEQCSNVTDEWLQSVVLAVNEEYVEPGEKVRSDITAALSVPEHASMTLRASCVRPLVLATSRKGC